MLSIAKFTHSTLVFLAEKIYNKFNKQALRQKGKDFHKVLVAGTVGKTSQMLILNQGFQKLDYEIWTGTTVNKNLNSLSGLIMVLGEFRVSLERSGLLGKISFILRATWVWLFKNWKFSDKPLLLLYEIGPDHQYEIDEFVKVFKDGVNYLILTSLTGEHLAGFENDFNINDWNRVKEFIPPNYLESQISLVENNTISTAEKNCYIDQLKLLEITDTYYIPAETGLISCDIICKTINDTSVGPSNAEKLDIYKKPNVKRGVDFSLVVGNHKLSSKYLVPLSFSRQIYLAQLLLENFKIKQKDFADVLTNLELPNSRFGFFDSKKFSKIVDSSYNNDPSSIHAFLDLLLETRANKVNYLVLGEMRELGTEAKTEHQKVINRLKEMSINSNLKVYLLGKEWDKCEFNRRDFKQFERVGQIIKLFSKHKFIEDSWIWIKGSQNTIFLESLVENLLANHSDVSRLGRRGSDWDLIRKPYL